MKNRYDYVPTPFGEALVVFSDEGVALFDVPAANEKPEWMRERASQVFKGELHQDPGAADELAHLVDAYFAGEQVDFRDHVTFDWQLVSGFTKAALGVINNIAYGETMGYGEVAALAGSPRAARAVGTACRLTPFSIIVPVHRVVRSDGSPGEYGGHPERKRFLLDLERGAATGSDEAPVQ